MPKQNSRGSKKNSDRDIDAVLKSIIELKESIKELRESQKETSKQIKELRESQKKTDEQIKELRESQKKTDEQMKKTDERIGNLGREIGKLRDSQSEFMEGIVLPSAQNFVESLGLRITGTLQNYELKDEKGQVIAEYDSIIISGSKVFIVEVKSSAGSKDVDKFIENIKKLDRSNIKFSEVYGIIVSARFRNGTEKYALRKGLAVLMPSGEILTPSKKNFKPILKKRK